MMIKTRKLPATSTDGERMRATADNGATLTIPYPYTLENLISPNRYVAVCLARAMGWNEDVRHGGGHNFHTEER